MEALSFLTKLRLPSVVQHLRHRIRIDDAAGLPHSQAARALMNTMLELFAARRKPFDTNAARHVMRSTAHVSHTTRVAVGESSPLAPCLRGDPHRRVFHPHVHRSAIVRERMP
ncbi:hypothetical protein [Burkholderia sp. BCC1993]|uniref:hypothetical protein n=1 Tax=Burkholderia sp. BCC1993 TaxID=2817444 RepID=UPI002AAF2884|nr:hypothetical protein [Burkholderia sp. BCC1993]